MVILRKIFLFVIALAVGIGVFLLYNLLTGPPLIEVGGGYKIIKNDKPAVVLEEERGSIGDTVIGETEVSEFNLLDPQGNIKSRFGFKKLIHSEGLDWELEKPYVNIYDEKYTCRVVSDTGFIRIEMVAGKPVPVSARLNDNVVIDFKNDKGDQDFKVLLPSLAYDIERNSFESGGSVELVSEQMTMSGKGMTLIYNPEQSRIELLKIPSLDYIKLKERRLKSESGASGTGVSFNEGMAQSTPQTADAGAMYEFILDDNVTVLTENETINASTVRISNILWQQNESVTDQASSEQSQAPVPVAGDPPAKKSADGFEYWQPEADIAVKDVVPVEEPSEPQYETVTTLHITCDGGLIFRPLQEQPSKADAQRTLDLIGSPVTVNSERFVTESPYVWYGFDSKTLRLYSRDQGGIVLATPDGSAVLKAEDSLFWDQAKSLAVVKGPGSIYAADDSEATETMLNFADTINLKMQDKRLHSARVTGGFDADITGDNAARISSRTAFVTFDDQSRLSGIELSQDVKIAAEQGGVNADFVTVDFAPGADGRPRPRKAVAKGNAVIVGGEQSRSYSPIMNASNIEYDFTNETATASGNIELSFTVASEDGRRDMPLTINADRNVIYKPGDGRVEFNENVRGVTLSEYSDYSEQSTFKCDNLIVYIEESAGSPQSPALKRLVLEGDKVVIENKRFTPKSLINVVNLVCTNFDYDAEAGIMTAKGPGSIKVNNRNVAGVSGDNEISFGGPCYALIENFSTLTFNTQENRITALRSDKMLHIGYVPILSGNQTGTQRLLDTGRIDISYKKTPDGRTRISRVKATDKVAYYEPEKYQLIGDNLEYSESTGIVKVRGTQSNPCVLNSSLVESIEYNIRTGNIKTDISGVSSVPVN
jgi:hypothetical protein